ncbi:hypothetical protein [Parvularcula lutaonensis]|uniref:Uncharacterized protein n=1 Tax=Parvularcula lutaonensis TaxID=491923 RepID=A0ABV7M9J9_9PROT|nr:hypothetical protein [Parvularcula lutaonensis]GGY47403.1 hypothetical protein GCM10007148_15930 [Parvularcula lutaonensis]
MQDHYDVGDEIPEIDPEIFGELEREIPLLFGVRKLAEGFDQISWFAHLGEPPTEDVRRTAAQYLDALGFPDADLAILPTPDDAAAAAETLDWASPAWEAEELARADLNFRAAEVLSEDALEIAIRLVTAKAGEAAKQAMAEEGAVWDIESEAVKNIAVGAAVQTATNAALVLLAGAADPEVDVANHVFTKKLKLFELGRWPVSVLGQSFSLF